MSCVHNMQFNIFFIFFSIKCFFCCSWLLFEKIRACFTFKSNLNMKNLKGNAQFIFLCNLYFWGEWPSGLRRFYQNRKVPGSKPTRRSARLRDPTSLRGSQGPSGQTCKNRVIKGYLRYKTITSENVSSEAQIKNFFIL